MKKYFVFAIIAILTIVAPAFAGESRYNLKNLTNTSLVTSGINIQVDENRMMTLSELYIVPPKVNPDNKKWVAKSVKLFSGILEMTTKDALVINLPVVNGKVSETLYDLGTKLGGPVVEHFWLRGTNGKKVDYPILFGHNNMWICGRNNTDGTVNDKTLFIGMVFYPKNIQHPAGVILPLKVVLKVTGKYIDGTYYPQYKQSALALTNAQMKRAISMRDKNMLAAK